VKDPNLGVCNARMKPSTLLITLSLGVLCSVVLPQAEALNCFQCAADACATTAAATACPAAEDACSTTYDDTGKVTEKKCITEALGTDEVHTKTESKCKKDGCNDYKSKVNSCFVCPAVAEKGDACPAGKAVPCPDTDNYCSTTWNDQGVVTEKKCLAIRTEAVCSAGTHGTCFCQENDCNTQVNGEAGASSNETTTEEVSDGASTLCQTSMLTGLVTLFGLPLLRA